MSLDPSIEGGCTPHSVSFLQHQYELLGIAEHLARPDVTEICINQPGEIHLETRQGWQCQKVPSLTMERARGFCVATVNESRTGQRITEAEPIVSLTFPTGQRAQFVLPPACASDQISITIRLPGTTCIPLSGHERNGLFERLAQPMQSDAEVRDRELMQLKATGRYAEFFAKAMRYRKNIVVAGATGSGKTTFMKSLVGEIDARERIVTLEDARELFIEQPNRVHLLYSKGAASTATVTAKTCMEACLRMRPDRIILAELRGDETFYFLRNCASGHPGTITSCHAGSTQQAWQQLALMIKASPEGSTLEYPLISELLRSTIDIVVHLGVDHGKRRISNIDFLPRAIERQAVAA